MKKGLPLILLGITFLLLALAGGLLIYSRRVPRVEQNISTPLSERYGQLDIDQADLPSSNPYKELVLNNLRVLDFIKDSINFEGEDVTVVNIILVYQKGGKENNFILPLVEKVTLSEIEGEKDNVKFTSKGLVSVEDIPFRKGEVVTITLAYIPEDRAEFVNQLPEFCNGKDSGLPVCNAQQKVGFGIEPIDIDRYISSLLERVGEKLDYKKAIVQSITRNLVIEP